MFFVSIFNKFPSCLQGGPQKCPYFSLAITSTKLKKLSRFFLHRYWRFIEFFLVETTLESIMFYYNFSVTNTMFFPCTALLYDSIAAPRHTHTHTHTQTHTQNTSATQTLKLASHFSNRTLEHLRHNFRKGSFRVKPITPGYPIPKISTRLTIFRGVTERQSL